jgi:hypothetical protein
MQQAPVQLSRQVCLPLRSSTAPTVAHKKGRITDIGVWRLWCLCQYVDVPKSLPCCYPKFQIIRLYMGGRSILLKYYVSIQIWPLLLDCWNHLINKHSSIHYPCNSYCFCFNCSCWSVCTTPLCCLPLNEWPHPNLTITNVHLPSSLYCSCAIAAKIITFITSLFFCETQSGTGSSGVRSLISSMFHFYCVPLDSCVATLLANQHVGCHNFAWPPPKFT